MNINQDKIYKYLLDEIINGELALKDRIPTELELSKMFGATRMDAHRAVKKLEEFGILTRNKKRGTRIKQVPSSITTGELKSVNTRRICVLIHTKENKSHIHWNERIVKSFETTVQKNKAEIVFKNISDLNTLDALRAYIKCIAEEGYNSLVIVSDYFIDNILTEHPELFFQFHNNVFIFDRGTAEWHSWPYHIVSVDLFREGVLAVEHLMQNSYEKIIYCKKAYDLHWAEERERGVKFGLMRLTEGKVKPEVFNLKETPESRVADLIKSSDETCAVIGANDEIASEIFKIAKESGLEPGVDFGLLGFDDNSEYRDYNLTTISPPLERIGETLAELVIDNLNCKQRGKIFNIRIDSEIIIRNTC